MFGDYFGQRADYSSGLFYSCHRKYLNDDELDAPNEFKTRKAVRNLRLTAKQEKEQYGLQGRRLSLMPSIPGAEKVGLRMKVPNRFATKKFRQVANLVVTAKVIEQSIQERREKDDWVQKSEAGVKMWVNTKTGDVMTENPFGPEKVASVPSVAFPAKNTKGLQQRRLNGLLKNKASEDLTDFNSRSWKNSSPIRRTRSKSLDDIGSPGVMGTAFLVYDREPVEELFDLLDHFDAKKK